VPRFEAFDLQLTATLLASFRTEIGFEPVTAGSQVRIQAPLPERRPYGRPFSVLGTKMGFKLITTGS
jgi:hypothetical protein